jgi:hypothetical protein
MLDGETGLYFRDGKYVFPPQDRPWQERLLGARRRMGAGRTGQVLADMPVDHPHRDFFVHSTSACGCRGTPAT